MQDFGYALGRALLSVIFLVSGFTKLMDVTAIGRTLGNAGFPQPRYFGYAVAAAELIGGAMLLLGFRARWVALALFLFTAGTIVIAHAFWTMEGAARAANQVQALKNLAIMGGLLLVGSVGSGRLSLDGRRG